MDAQPDIDETSFAAADILRGGLAALVLTAAMQVVAEDGEAREPAADGGQPGPRHHRAGLIHFGEY
jgi:hypothetical protein